VDGPDNKVLAFDNMQDRPIKGTTDWTNCAVVLDVPANAAGIMFGLILEHRGKAWFDGVTLEPVGTDVPSTHIANPYEEYYEGRYAEAARMFRDMIARTPASFSYKLFHFLALHRSGQAQEARAYINGVAASLADQKWAGPVVLFYAGKLPEDEVLKAAASADPKIDKEQRCEAYYYLAMAYHLKLGGVQVDAAAAAKVREYLEKCVATGVTTFVEYRAAQAELGRLKR
jgi:lipoprotein NlpI